MRVIVGGCYEVISRLGAGKFGVVVLCKNTYSGKNAAVKIEPSTQGMLKREASIYRLLRGVPNIPTLLAYGQEGVYSYLAMPFLGMPLSKVGRAAIAMLVGPLVCVLHSIHGLGVIHGDIKPDNILLGPEGVPCLIDFGLARYGGPPSAMLSKLVGSKAYCSRRVLALHAPIESDDIESLCLTLLACAEIYLPGSLATRALDIADLEQRGARRLLEYTDGREKAPQYMHVRRELCRLLDGKISESKRVKD